MEAPEKCHGIKEESTIESNQEDWGHLHGGPISLRSCL